jgi:serine/threonine-protein kinase RsbW
LKKTATYHITVGASTRNLSVVREFVSEHARAEGFSENVVSDVCLAVDEAYTNIIKHAYNFDSTKKVEVDLEFDNEKICVCLTDTGESFDKSNYTVPDIPKQIKNKKRGGMGVFLIQKLMDHVDYHIGNRENEIKMYKNRETA